MNQTMGDIDWNAIFDKVTTAIPNIATAVYGYKTATAQAKYQAQAAQYSNPFAINPNYSGLYTNTPPGTIPGNITAQLPATNLLPILLIGGVALAAVLLMKD